MLSVILKSIFRRHREKMAVLNRIAKALENLSLEASAVLAILAEANVQQFGSDGSELTIPQRVRILADKNLAIKEAKDEEKKKEKEGKK